MLFTHRLATGENVVANAGTNELRSYDSTGKFMRTVRREGGGPGGFESMMGIWGVGPDPLAVFDYGNARMTVGDNRGEFGRTTAPFPSNLAMDLGPRRNSSGRMGFVRSSVDLMNKMV